MMPHRSLGLLLLATLGGCAQVREPTGGPVDETPPRLVLAEPPTGSTGVRPERILLSFDERIKLDRVRDNLVISPPLAVAPDVRVTGGRTVEVRLNAPLEQGTTYVFNFGNSVLDLTEGNAASDLNYVIATGENLDSLTIQGTVRVANSGMAAPDVPVMAYPADDTTGFTQGRPRYLTRTGARGEFLFHHLAPGRYQVYALRDKNGNLRYDLPNEEVAFLEGPTEARPLDTLGGRSLDLWLFREHPRQQAILDHSVTENGAWRWVFAKPVNEVSIADLARRGGRTTWRMEVSEGRDTVLAWPSDTTALDAGEYEVSADDVALDTLKYRRDQAMPFLLEISPPRTREGTHHLFSLRTSRPVAALDQDKALAIGTSGDQPVALRSDPDEVRSFLVEAPAAMERLILFPGAVKDIYGGTHDTLRVSLGRADPTELGLLRVELRTPERAEGLQWLEFLDRQGAVAQRLVVDTIPGTYTWPMTPPGIYELRLFHDTNENGRWDPGRLDDRQQPEVRLRLEGPVNVRPNWEVDVVW